MNKFLNEVYDRISAANSGRNIILYMLCALSMLFIEANRFSNIIHYPTIMAISAVCGGFLFCILYGLAKNHVSQNSQKSILSNIRDITIISFGCALILSAPFYLLITTLNSYFDSSPVQIQNVEVLERKLRTLGRHNQVPELCVDLQSGKDDAVTPYSIDVTWDLYNASNAGDRVKVGVRKGALGFSHVVSVEKVGQ